MVLKKGISNTKFVVTVGIFSAISFVLQMIGSLMGIKVGGFLEIEISDLPPLILSLAYGPFVGIFVELIKNFLHCFVTTTGFVGEFANFVINGMLCGVAGFVYKFKRTYKGAILSLITGVIVMTLAGALVNFFVMLPLYMPNADFSTKFSIVTSLIMPFNLARGTVLSIITVLLYKRISKAIK